MKKFEEKTITKNELFKGKIISLQIEDVELPNGKTSKREIIKHPGAVCVIAKTDDDKLIMVEQYRKALERSIVEIPAGKLEPGELPEVTAERELEEETGYGCKTLTHLISFYTSPGFADELVHVYIAEGLYKIENSHGTDEDEFVELMEVTLEEAEKMVLNQRIFDAKTAYAVQYLRLEQLRKLT
ncbi:NUDIX hydrolase [Jeotgalibacillus haloalkalitolerans]|uniref:NUDIX hydrolase n=1 Tax=Jeotgalibacillus haloalkalitolerans TaxID=3104292 RepID=A0ABU5KLD8_9BACL|nr:NUDIX hydrolase [Jeotgalibacillus sp. HH7-29]MDZ5712071.1 NUDIX hydrolase [Jeotgalibacillus sp. HH7-29]